MSKNNEPLTSLKKNTRKIIEHLEASWPYKTIDEETRRDLERKIQGLDYESRIRASLILEDYDKTS